MTAQPHSAPVPAAASRGRARRHITVELRQVSEPPPVEELRRREEELERLIIKAACRRAARLAGLSAPSAPSAVQASAPPRSPSLIFRAPYGTKR